jgi:exportin-1
LINSNTTGHELMLLVNSEEVFDFSVDHMTVAKMSKLKNQMVNEFGSIFDLCKQVLSSQTTNNHLIHSTLETLLKFISWIPVQFVYQQDLIQILESNVIKRPLKKKNEY